jgi:hypothetical protein
MASEVRGLNDGPYVHFGAQNGVRFRREEEI